jgi:hypothetical protein
MRPETRVRTLEGGEWELVPEPGAGAGKPASNRVGIGVKERGLLELEDGLQSAGLPSNPSFFGGPILVLHIALTLFSGRP